MSLSGKLNRLKEEKKSILSFSEEENELRKQYAIIKAKLDDLDNLRKQKLSDLEKREKEVTSSKIDNLVDELNSFTSGERREYIHKEYSHTEYKDIYNPIPSILFNMFDKQYQLAPKLQQLKCDDYDCFDCRSTHFKGDISFTYQNLPITASMLELDIYFNHPVLSKLNNFEVIVTRKPYYFYNGRSNGINYTAEIKMN